MTYAKHMLANFRVAVRCQILSAFHVVHGVIPCKWTSHDFW